jgi:putative hydrolase
MGKIDLHIHTVKSPCGLHTLLEILDLAAERNMSLIAITDHDFDAAYGTRVFSYRFPGTWKGIRVLKGIELSIRDGGQVKIPSAVKLKDLDICLAGFHATNRKIGHDPVKCTDDLQAALQRYPFIDILTHPTIAPYDLQHERAARLLAEHGVAAEANNSALLLGKEEEPRVVSMLSACARQGVPVAVDSDTHAAPELGGDELALQAVEKAGVPEDMILTRSVESVLDFVEKRRKNKLDYQD